jgi:hypothetical protein
LIGLVAKRPSPVLERPTRYGLFEEMEGMTERVENTNEAARAQAKAPF